MLALCTGLLALNACTKDHTPSPEVSLPAMSYIDLKDKAVSFKQSVQLDLNSDGEWDILFSTMLVGDAVMQQDKQQWLVSSSFYTNLPVNENEQVPAMRAGQPIPVQNFSGHQWFNASSVILAQRIISMTGNPYWDGNWKQASHSFLPIQIKKGADLYNGWIELSFNSEEAKVILHRAAVVKEKNKEIFAGK